MAFLMKDAVASTRSEGVGEQRTDVLGTARLLPATYKFSRSAADCVVQRLGFEGELRYCASSWENARGWIKQNTARANKEAIHAKKDRASLDGQPRSAVPT
jgi:hypothetical protein